MDFQAMLDAGVRNQLSSNTLWTIGHEKWRKERERETAHARSRNGWLVWQMTTAMESCHCAGR